MSSSSNSPTPDRGRRRLLGVTLGAALAAAFVPLSAWADAVSPLPGLRRWGRGPFRRFGFLVYEATLWAGDDPLRPPLALRLDYRRRIAGTAIAEASIDEMRRLGSDPEALAAWQERLARLFPDVAPGDHIVGLYRPDGRIFCTTGAISGASTIRALPATSSPSGSTRAPARRNCARPC